MDIVRANPETHIPSITGPTLAAFRPIHESNRASIESHPKKTFQFGKTSRHKLDIYSPATTFPGIRADSKKVPILFWVYGGGFISGGRNLPAPDDLIYGNIGKYFADRGFLTVIADYQLAPTFQYPAPLQDIFDAIKWVVDHPEELKSGFTGSELEGDTDNIFLIGHSAGASHVSTMLLHPEVMRLPEAKAIRRRIRGAILCAGTYHFSVPDHGIEDLCAAFWGSMDAAHRGCAKGLLDTAPDEWVTGDEGLPPILFVEAEKDPQWLRTSRIDLVDALEKRGVEKIEVVIAKDHNHVSAPAGLGIGDGEQWAVDVIDWIKHRVQC